MSTQLDTTTTPEIKLTDTEKFYERLAEIQQQDNTDTTGGDKKKEIEEADDLDLEVDNNTNDDESSNNNNDDAEKHLIPRTRLNKELEKRRALEAQLEKEKEERIKIQAQIEMYNSALAKMEKGFNIQNKEAEEDFAPLDEKSHDILSKQIQEVKEFQKQMLIQKKLEMQEHQFQAEHPDSQDAYNYLLKIQARTNKNLGYSEEEATALAYSNLEKMAVNLLDKNKNVAETFYNIAKDYGYSSSPNKNKTPNLEAINNNMKKSKTIDTGSAAVNLSDGGRKYTKFSTFQTEYKGDKDKFYRMLNAVEGDR